MKLKRYKKKTIGVYLSREIMLIVLAIIVSFIIIDKLSIKFNNIALSMAEAKTKKYVSMIINEATNKIKFDENLFSIDKNESNEIKMIKYDSYEATKLINEITYNIQNRLDKLESGNSDMIEEIPLGVVFNNAIIRNMGPKIGVKISIIGDLITELQTSVKPYGINNALVEVTVSITANARITLPLNSKEIQVKNMIPISISIVNGSIPEAYISTYR